MKVLFLPKYYEEGPSSRYRTHNYKNYFEYMGHEVNVYPLFYNGYVKGLYNDKSKKYFKIAKSFLKRLIILLVKKNQYDVLIIEKELFPYLPYIIEKILLSNIKYTLDFDDAISVKYRNSKLKKNLLGEKINKLSKRAIITTVGNKWYWNEIKFGNLKYLPTVINLNNYELNKLNKSNDIPTIVWIGSPSTIKYLNIIVDSLILLHQNYKFKLKVIGSEIEIDGLEVECLEWNSEKELQYLSSSDIGIMPLEDTEWEYGKCGFKCIQYMASKLPVVATYSPANAEIIEDGITGFIVYDKSDWYEKLEQLIINKNLRETMGSNGRHRVESNYTYQVWGTRYVSIVENQILNNIN